MNSDEAIKAIRKEMNRRRRYGGAEDVPVSLWNDASVSQDVARAAQCAQEEAFDGDWDGASVSLEQRIEAVAAALRRASVQRPFEGRRKGAGSLQRPRQDREDRFLEPAKGGGDERVSRPEVVRRDAGSEALGDYLSWHWQNDAWARYQHARVCGGDYLTREEAWQFLTSPLPKVMGYEDYERLGLCPARTTGRILSKYLSHDGLLLVTNMLMVDPETRQVTATVDTLHGDIGNYCVEINLPDEADRTARVKRLVLNLSERNYHYIACDDLLPKPYRVEDGRDRDVCYPPQAAPYFEDGNLYVEGYNMSLMGELIATADFLCNEFSVSIWDMLEALLTGRIPPQSSVEIFSQDTRVVTHEPLDVLVQGFRATGFAAQGPATLTVQPWVTPEVLADTWREFRKQNACYSPSVKQAEAVRFVLSHTPPGEDFAWERLAAQWEQERGEMMTRGTLYKQFQRARAAILPGYRELDEDWLPGDQ